jgi:hypothetical protein
VSSSRRTKAADLSCVRIAGVRHPSAESDCCARTKVFPVIAQGSLETIQERAGLRV